MRRVIWQERGLREGPTTTSDGTIVREGATKSAVRPGLRTTPPLASSCLASSNLRIWRNLRWYRIGRITDPDD